MPSSEILDRLLEILTRNAERAAKAEAVADVIRRGGPYRWVGLYDVDCDAGMVRNIAWSGPGAPAYPDFLTTKGLTSRAIATKKTVNVGDVAGDSDYLTALDDTRAEMILPILDRSRDRVIGTIDVESERLDAFDEQTRTLLEVCAEALKEFWLNKAD
ncbi:MAG TPA: GAF domain-containing protein [Acidobacteriaceae bacterium]|nr:GAF domain-containing protein [Acidobacteriaceae bacterium]